MTPALILQLLTFLIAETPEVVMDIQKLKANLTLSPDVTANLKNLVSDIDTTSDTAIAEATAYLAAHGQA